MGGGIENESIKFFIVFLKYFQVKITCYLGCYLGLRNLDLIIQLGDLL